VPSKDSAQQNVLQGFVPDFEEDFKENQSISITSYSTSQQLPQGLTIILKPVFNLSTLAKPLTLTI